MDYKALMLDIDGTLIHYDYNALPSKVVCKAIRKAKEKGVIACLVTGRSYPSTIAIAKALEIQSGYIVVDGGALVYKLGNDKPLYKRYITKKDLDAIVKVFTDLKVDFYIKDAEGTFKTKEYYAPYQNGDILNDVSMVFTDEIFTLDQTHKILKKLSIPTINVFRNLHKDPDKYSFNITHAQATKLHGIEVIQKHTNIEREEIIGCGDGYNDFPLLMASGLKVAMGNAIEDLKEIADYVAPTVEDDGVADVVEKFILS